MRQKKERGGVARWRAVLFTGTATWDFPQLRELLSGILAKMCRCSQINIVKMEEKHGKIDSPSIDLAQNQGFCCGSSEGRLKEWQKPHKIGSKNRVKVRFQQNNTEKTKIEGISDFISTNAKDYSGAFSYDDYVKFFNKYNQS